MGRTEEMRRAVEAEAEAEEARVHAAISGLDPDGLVTWCRQIMDAPHITWRLNLQSVILRSGSGDFDLETDSESAIELAERDADWHYALIEVARDLRKQGNAIPQPWRDHLSDLYLGIAEKPDRRGQPKPVQRDELICRCIGLIERHTPYTATINEGADPETACAVNIVAKALGDKPGRERVLKIWKAHRKKLRSDL